MEISPFSLSLNWSLHFIRISSRYKRVEQFNAQSESERKALEALANIGLISGRQLKRIFKLDRKRLKSMVIEQKIIRHELKVENKITAIYTLGINGAVMTGIEESYEMNYWIAYKVEDVLKRILFFQLYEHFNEHPNRSIIQATPKPFIGSLEFNNVHMHVYVVRGDINELLTFFKWNELKFNERIIIVAESVRHVELLKSSLSKFKVRVALDKDLLKKTERIQDMFYFIKDGEFVRE